jgi:trigger factor
VLGTLKEGRFEVEKQLSFKDGLAPRFGEQIRGARAGDTRVVDVNLSTNAAGGLGGKHVLASFDIKDVKTLRLPDLTPEFLREQFGLHSQEELDEAILVLLKRQLEHAQRRSARQQIISQISAASQWELPQDLLMRQARRALNRRIMEMKSDGMSDAEINRQRRLLEQDILKTTEVSLREHFVFQKIADIEKIEVDDDDINDEIDRIAEQSDESPRRVRARLEKEGMIDALAADMVERKALDLILDAAEYEDVPLDQEEAQAPVATVEAQAVPGPMQELPSDAKPPQAQESVAALQESGDRSQESVKQTPP